MRKVSSRPGLPIEAARWRWVSRFGARCGTEFSHPPHARWMVGNTHVHSHREIMAVLEGDHFYGVRNRIYRARPGTAFLFDRDEPHDCFYSPHQLPCRDLWIIFTSPRQAFIQELAVERQAGPPDAWRALIVRTLVVSGSMVAATVESWDRCAREGREPAAVARLQAAAAALLYHAEDLLKQPHIAAQGASEQMRIVRHIQDYVRRHPSDDLSLATLARMAGYSPVYFHRLYRRYSGERLHTFVNSVRLERAKLLLQEGRTVRSVADDLGFGTPAYFSRFFKDAAGYAPREYGATSPREPLVRASSSPGCSR